MIEKMAECEPEELRGMIAENVERIRFGRFALSLAEARCIIVQARRLSKVIEY